MFNVDTGYEWVTVILTKNAYSWLEPYYMFNYKQEIKCCSFFNKPFNFNHEVKQALRGIA